MQLVNLSVQQFRNLDEASFHFHPRLTIFLGPNGSGKTNILEAISLLSLPRSFRGSKDRELVLWNQDFARVTGQIKTDNGQVDELVVFLEQAKRLFVNNRPVKTSEFLGTFWSVVFAPEDVDLLQGPPSRRRAFLDGFLSLVWPQYFYHLVVYQRVLARRNKLLSERQVADQEFVYWNEEQVLHGSFVAQARERALRELQSYLPDAFRLQFLSSLGDAEEEDIKEAFQRKQSSMFSRERQVGYSLVGPQRDDFRLLEVWPVERDMGVYGSRGEQRMVVILLKQAELAWMVEQKQTQAVLLLDDVLSELDAQNQDRLLHTLYDRQTILTTASLADVSPTLLDDAMIYEKVEGVWRERV